MSVAFPVHHAGLGSFVRVYLNRPDITVEEALEYCRSFPQVLLAINRVTATNMFEMPLDREGDIVLVSQKNAAFGAGQEEYGFGQLKDQRLRSHGGLPEQAIPLLRSLPANEAPMDREWRKFDAFDIALNW